MASEHYGFIGLGNMGQPMSRHVCAAGFEVHVFDIAGTKERAPTGAHVAASTEQVCENADVIALSLPTVESNQEVVRNIAAAGRKGSVIIDTCTIGPAAAEENARILKSAGIDYVDSPVSGLKFGAEQATLASMAAGNDTACERARPLIECYSKTMYRVGHQPGQGQRMKVVNNALYISALVATSEVMAYGEHGGLDTETMLEVLNASSGQNFVTQSVFPKFLVSEGDKDSGAEAHIIQKDLGLFVDGARDDSIQAATVTKSFETVDAFASEDPLQDMIRIYGFVRGKKAG